MFRFKQLLTDTVNWCYAAKEKNLEWLIHNQAHFLKLRETETLAKNELEATLRLKNAHFNHELNTLKARQAAELSMLKTRCNADIKDYEDYLKSLAQLKHLIRQSYQHLPEAIANTIHHHAKQLLNAMWESDDLQKKIELESQFVKFMTVIHEEISTKQNQSLFELPLPEKTLNLISASKPAN
jgi:hypothetical protein